MFQQVKVPGFSFFFFFSALRHCELPQVVKGLLLEFCLDIYSYERIITWECDQWQNYIYVGFQLRFINLDLLSLFVYQIKVQLCI